MTYLGGEGGGEDACFQEEKHSGVLQLDGTFNQDAACLPEQKTDETMMQFTWLYFRDINTHIHKLSRLDYESTSPAGIRGTPSIPVEKKTDSGLTQRNPWQ